MRSWSPGLCWLAVASMVVGGCGGSEPVGDGGARDSAAGDAAAPDAPSRDSSAEDAHGADADSPDAARDAGRDTSTPDAAVDGSADAGVDGGASSLEDVFDSVLFGRLFPHRADSSCHGGDFDFASLRMASARFPRFGTEGSLDDRKREVAAFLANISHETTGGWPTAPDGPQAWGLCFVQEVGCEAGACTAYCDPSRYACAAGKTYHGRGPIQLSWNYNYAQAGEALGLDLLNDPDLVVRDPVVGWLTALWFWMTPQAPKPSAHEVMVGAYTPSAADMAAGRLPGFGLTVDIINGGLECGHGADARVADRVAFYQRYTEILVVAPGDNLDCGAMSPY